MPVPSADLEERPMRADPQREVGHQGDGEQAERQPDDQRNPGGRE